VAEVLSQHVVLEVESIDRMYLNVIVGRLQILEGALRFIRQQRKAQVLSTNAVEPMTRACVESIQQFVRENQIPLITFEKGQRKDEVAARLRAKYPHREGVIFVGQAQARCTVYRTEKRPNPKKNTSYAWLVKSTALVNPYYFYCADESFGPFFPEVLFLLSLPCQVVPERTGRRQAPIGSRTDSPWTMASAPAPTPSACKQSAIPGRPKKSIRF
jgi:hypothetical protein